jgi:hypothetical protein
MNVGEQRSTTANRANCNQNCNQGAPETSLLDPQVIALTGQKRWVRAAL